MPGVAAFQRVDQMLSSKRPRRGVDHASPRAVKEPQGAVVFTEETNNNMQYNR